MGNCQTIQRNIQEDLNVHQHTYKNLFLKDQPDALIITILFCYKTLHVSGIFSAHHQGFFTVHSALVSFMQVSDDRFKAESGYKFQIPS
jgi:hypothetical protein